MSAAPDLLTLGIELELIVQGDQEMIRQQMAALLSSTLNITVVAPPDPKYKASSRYIVAHYWGTHLFHRTLKHGY